MYFRNIKRSFQYAFSGLIISIVGLVCFISVDYIGYKVVALILLMAVSFLAMVFDILPVLMGAFLSALIWNFFFIPPIYTFHIDSTENALMFLMYFLIALVNAVLSFKIRDFEKKEVEKEEQERTVELYNNILNSLSHELRTPISTIIGNTDILKENSQHLSEKNKNELLNEIDKAATRLNRQVENLLNINRVESGVIKLNKDWCDVNELILNVIQKEAVCTHIIEFTPDERLPFIKVDIGLIEQVLQNIILNAIAYTPSQTTIVISATTENNKCKIVIEDNGPGIPEELLNNIFHKFYRLPNTKTGGVGIGLSICKGFVSVHGGTLQVQNRLSGGAAFTILLPAEFSYINNLKNE